MLPVVLRRTYNTTYSSYTLATNGNFFTPPSCTSVFRNRRIAGTSSGQARFARGDSRIQNACSWRLPEHLGGLCGPSGTRRALSSVGRNVSEPGIRDVLEHETAPHSEPRASHTSEPPKAPFGSRNFLRQDAILNPHFTRATGSQMAQLRNFGAPGARRAQVRSVLERETAPHSEPRASHTSEPPKPLRSNSIFRATSNWRHSSENTRVPREISESTPSNRGARFAHVYPKTISRKVSAISGIRIAGQPSWPEYNIACAQSPTGIWPQAAIPVGSALRRPRKRGPLQAAAHAARWHQIQIQRRRTRISALWLLVAQARGGCAASSCARLRQGSLTGSSLPQPPQSRCLAGAFPRW